MATTATATAAEDGPIAQTRARRAPKVSPRAREARENLEAMEKLDAGMDNSGEMLEPDPNWLAGKAAIKRQAAARRPAHKQGQPLGTPPDESKRVDLVVTHEWKWCADGNHWRRWNSKAIAQIPGPWTCSKHPGLCGRSVPCDAIVGSRKGAPACLFEYKTDGPKNPKIRAQRSGKGAPVLNEENLALWFGYIAERQRVFRGWLRGGAGAPWTNDTIISGGRMCNVFRFLDRESAWVAAHILEPLQDRPADLIFNILIFRCYLNWHKSAEIVGLHYVGSFNQVEFERLLRSANEQLGKLSSAAYNTGSCNVFPVAEGKGSKCARFAAMFAAIAPMMGPLAISLAEKADSTFTFESICALPGVGTFPGFQACIDLGYWKTSIYNESQHTFVGPGAKEGLSWLFKDLGACTELGALAYLEEIQEEWFGRVGVSPEEQLRLFGDIPRPPRPFEPPEITASRQAKLEQRGWWGPGTGADGVVQGRPVLNLMAIENCLCEGNKYLRTHHGKGRFKQKYSGTTGADQRYRTDYTAMIRLLNVSWGGTDGQRTAAAAASAVSYCGGWYEKRPTLLLPSKSSSASGSKLVLAKPVGGGSSSSNSKPASPRFVLSKPKKKSPVKSPPIAEEGAALVGQAIARMFGDELYHGTVVGALASGKQFRVKYEDGDVEMLSKSEVLECLRNADPAAAGGDHDDNEDSNNSSKRRKVVLTKPKPSSPAQEKKAQQKQAREAEALVRKQAREAAAAEKAAAAKAAALERRRSKAAETALVEKHEKEQALREKERRLAARAERAKRGRVESPPSKHAAARGADSSSPAKKTSRL